jgi:hypothetical protein
MYDDLGGPDANVNIIIGATALFGPNHDVPVYLVDFERPEITARLRQFWKEHGVVEPGMDAAAGPCYHVTAKHCGVLAAGTVLRCAALEAKPVGPHDPFAVFSLA